MKTKKRKVRYTKGIDDQPLYWRLVAVKIDKNYFKRVFRKTK